MPQQSEAASDREINPLAETSFGTSQHMRPFQLSFDLRLQMIGFSDSQRSKLIKHNGQRSLVKALTAGNKLSPSSVRYSVSCVSTSLTFNEMIFF